MRSFLVYTFTFMLCRTVSPAERIARNAPMQADSGRVAAVDNFAAKTYKVGLRYPDIALSIAALETGNFKRSTTIMLNYNPFAMKDNSRKNFIRIGRSGYVVFASLEDALYDYAAYEAQVVAKYRLRSPADYWQHIITRYCKEPAYARKLYEKHQWLNREGYLRRRNTTPKPA